MRTLRKRSRISASEWFDIAFWFAPVWLYLIAIAMLFMFCGRAHACDDIAVASADSKCVAGMMWHGQRGAWFELGQVHEITFKMKVFPQLELQIDQLSKANALYASETSSLREAMFDLKAVNLNLQAQVALAQAAEKEARRAAERHWYSSPVFWGITMFIAGAAIQHACCQK